ncbi:dihydroneopterin triphosphate diphosphatase [soil metagenome]
MRTIEIVQGVVFRRSSGKVEFLVVKRVPSDGGFWQAVTGTIESGEDPLTTLKRELKEEAGLSYLLHVSEMLHTYEWVSDEHGVSGKDSVFTVEVPYDSEVVLEPSEHDDYKWLPLEEATRMLKYDGNKLSMRKAAEYAEQLI